MLRGVWKLHWVLIAVLIDFVFCLVYIIAFSVQDGCTIIEIHSR